MPRDFAIKVTGLSLNRGQQCILHSVNSQLPAGKLIAILGANGVGKSTLARALAGLAVPTTGTIVNSQNRSLAELSFRERALQLSWLGAETSLPFAFRVEEVIMMGRFPHHGGHPQKCDQTLVEQFLVDFNLLNLRQRSIHSLSSGQLQRVLLARAFAATTNTMIFDEPTTYLDPKYIHSTMKLCQKIVKEGKTIVMTINDVNLAAIYADHVLLLKNQELLDSGPKGAVLTEDNVSALYELPTKAYAVGRHLQFVFGAD